METIWTDGMVVDGSAPAGHGPDTLTLTVNKQTLAHSGDEVQALVDPGASVRPVPHCPVPSGSQVIAVQQVRVRPSPLGESRSFIDCPPAASTLAVLQGAAAGSQ